MPILSIVVFCLLIYIMLRKNTYINRYTDLFTITCVIKIYWFQGYFLKLGHNEISSIANLSNYFLLIYSLYLIISKKINIDIKVLKSVVCFVGVIFLGMVYEKIYPYSGLLMPIQDDVTNWDLYIFGNCSMYPYVPEISNMARSLLDITSFLLIIVVFKSIFSYKWFITPYMKIIGWLKYGIYYGYLEWIIKNLLGNLTITYSFAEMLLGANEIAIFTEATSRDGVFYSIQGLTRETSYFNGYLFTLALLMLFGNILKRMAKEYELEIPNTYNGLTLALCIMLFFITGGFSAVWFLFIVGICALLIRIRESKTSISEFLIKKKMIVVSFSIVCIIAVGALVQNEYFYKRIMDALSIIDFLSGSNGFAGIMALGSGDSIGSTIARFVSLYEGIIIFIDRPLMGLSYIVQPIHDWSLMLIINIGIVGMYFLYKVLISSKEKRRYDFFMLFLIFIIGGLPVNICPGALCVYWVLLFEVTTYYMNKIELK